MGYNVTIFCANSKHNSDRGLHFNLSRLWKEEINLKTGVPYVFVKAKPYKSNGKDRIINMVDYYRNLLQITKDYVAKEGKPDVIYASSVHPLTLLAGIKLANKYNIKCISEVRDLWPESIVSYGVANKNNPIIKALYKFEKYLYVHSDKLIFTMENAWTYFEERGLDRVIPRKKVIYLNNGVDLETYNENLEENPYKDIVLDNENLFKVVYTGSIRKVNKIGLLLDAAKLIQNPKVRIIIFGDGDELEYLKKRVKDEKIENVILEGFVSKKYIASITSKADLNFMHGSQSPVLKYGISPNKLYDYAAAKKPILTDTETPMNPAEIYGAAIKVPDQTPEDIAKTIDMVSRMGKSEYENYCKNAERLSQDYGYESLTKKFTGIIEGVKYGI